MVEAHVPAKEQAAPTKETSTPAVEPEFNAATKAEAEAVPLSRAEQIKRDMAEWRKRNDDKDFGREM